MVVSNRCLGTSTDVETEVSDELSLGLAPLIQQEVFEVIQKLNISTLLGEQNAKKALEVFKCYVLN
jgi:ABC-type branched-subunit amino acid transport system ATPase component